MCRPADNTSDRIKKRHHDRRSNLARDYKAGKVCDRSKYLPTSFVTRNGARVTVRTRPTPNMHPERKDVITSKKFLVTISKCDWFWEEEGRIHKPNLCLFYTTLHHSSLERFLSYSHVTQPALVRIPTRAQAKLAEKVKLCGKTSCVLRLVPLSRLRFLPFP